MKFKNIKHKFLCVVQDIKLKIQLWYLISFGYYDKDFTPLRCPHCKSEELEDCNIVTLNGYGSTILEYNCKCEKCGKILNHWAYGYWER